MEELESARRSMRPCIQIVKRKMKMHCEADVRTVCPRRVAALEMPELVFVLLMA